MQLSFLIQKSPDQRLFTSFPELIAGDRVFRRLSMPRHPPYTLSSLTKFIDHRHTGQYNAPGLKNSRTGSITCHIAKKVLDDIHPTERQQHCSGDHCFAGMDIAEGLQINKPTALVHLRPFTLNLTIFICQRATYSAKRG
jgi:hypothetical protein